MLLKVISYNAHKHVIHNILLQYYDSDTMLQNLIEVMRERKDTQIIKRICIENEKTCLHEKVASVT